MTDEELIEKLMKRDEAVLEEILNIYGQKIHWTVAKILNKPEEWMDIEEIISEVLLQVWQNIARYDCQKASFYTWLQMMAKSRALDYKRKHRKTEICIDDIELKVKTDVLRNDLFLSTLEPLDDLDKQIFFAYYYQQATAIEISQKLNLPVNVIYNHLSRGRKKIAQRRSKHGDL